MGSVDKVETCEGSLVSTGVERTSLFLDPSSVVFRSGLRRDGGGIVMHGGLAQIWNAEGFSGMDELDSKVRFLLGRGDYSRSLRLRIHIITSNSQIVSE